MHVTVTLIGPLKKYFDGEQSRSVELPEKANIDGLLKKIGLSHAKFSFITINGVKVVKEQRIFNNDKIVIFPLVSGG